MQMLNQLRPCHSIPLDKNGIGAWKFAIAVTKGKDKKKTTWLSTLQNAAHQTNTIVIIDN